jgi:hypothetical protein
MFLVEHVCPRPEYKMEKVGTKHLARDRRHEAKTIWAGCFGRKEELVRRRMIAVLKSLVVTPLIS